MNDWVYEIRIPSDSIDEYKKWSLGNAREEVGRKLFEILYSQKLPCVVDIDEEIIQLPKQTYIKNEWISLYSEDLIRYRVSIMPVHHRHVTMETMLLEPPLPFKPYKDMTFFDRCRKYVKEIIKRITS